MEQFSKMLPDLSAASVSASKDTQGELLPCPFCGGECHVTEGYATEQVWAYGTFYRVFCGVCQARQLFYKTKFGAIAAWNRRASQVSAAAPDTATLQFLTDVVTAAGLLAHGRTSKALAKRISESAYSLREELFHASEGQAQTSATADAARLDWIEGWCQRGAAKGYRWDQLDFTADKPIRQQLDERIAATKPG